MKLSFHPGMVRTGSNLTSEVNLQTWCGPQLLHQVKFLVLSEILCEDVAEAFKFPVKVENLRAALAEPRTERSHLLSGRKRNKR